MLDIFRTGLNEILVKTLGMKPGASAPAGILTPEIGANITLESDRPEYHFLGGSTLWSLQESFDQTLTSDIFQIQITVPAGQLHVVEYAAVTVHHTAAATSCCKAWVNFAGSSGLVSAGSITCFAADARWGARSLLGIQSLSAGVGGSVVDHAQATGVTAAPFTGQCTLLHRGYPIIAGPGQQWGISIQTADASFGEAEVLVNFRSRTLQPAELIAA